MRSFALMAATTVILAGAWACGSDSNGPSNTSPVANFTAPACTVGVACTFTDASSDPDGTIASRSWDFGDGTTSQDANPSHTFGAAQTYQVTLTVTDNGGATNAKTVPVTVTGGTGNVPPTAAFTAPSCTVNSACGFTDGSSDSDGTLTAWAWNFGDGTAVDNNQNTNHTFGAQGTYQVQLTVTDNAGATASVTVPVTVAAASASQCTTLSTTEVDCLLTIAASSTIIMTLTSADCELGGNLVFIPPPDLNVAQNVFSNACNAQIGQQYTLKDESGATLVLPAGFQLHVRLRRGTGDPAPGSPAGNITGTGPTWTLNFDDGGNPGGLGEPDFGDVVVTVQANPA